MGAVFGRKIQGYLAASSVAAFLMLAVACGSQTPPPSGGQVGAAPTAESEQPPSSPATLPATPKAETSTESVPAPSTAVAETETATPTPASEPVSEANDNNPVLINTPGPVALLAPDFTLPSIDGQEYTLSEFRGKQPVLVVFYRAYW